MMSRFAWRPYVRIALFWIVFVATVWGLSSSEWLFSLAPIPPVASQIFKSDFSGVSRPEFAYALAAFLVMTGTGFAVAFGLMHALAIGLTMRSARKLIEGVAEMGAFSDAYETIYQKLKAHPLVGGAWE